MPTEQKSQVRSDSSNASGMGFAANLPADQQDILRRIDTEASMGLRGRENGTFRSISNSVESFYEQTVGHGQNGTSPAFADRGKAIERMKEYYNECLGKTDPKDAGFPGPAGMIKNEHTFALVRAHHGITDEELGLSTRDRAGITEATQEAYTMQAQQLYAEAEMRIKAGKRELTPKESSGSSTYFGREVSPASLLHGARYALEQGGHDTNSNDTYKLLDPDMTKKNFDQLQVKMDAAQPQPTVALPKPGQPGMGGPG